MSARPAAAVRIAVALVLVASSAWAARQTPQLDGSWTGSVDIGQRRAAMTAAATLGQVAGGIAGVVALGAGPTAESYAVTGALQAGRIRLAGALPGRRLVWKARWSRKRRAWRGQLRIRDSRRTMHGRLTLVRDGDRAAACGLDFFAQELMPKVFAPICAQCHVSGGVAQGTRLHVVAGDPLATAESAVTLVDVANPGQSWLLLKPRGDLPHGGGQRFVAGSAEDTALQQWIALVTAPGCGGTGGGGGGGPTGDLYTDNCANCHGADARGLDGRPDIHCNRSIHDAVRNGRGAAGEMPPFPNLGDADIATIQAFLVGLCPATSVTGAELYAGNCASCHGSDATGTATAPSVRCATLVSDAVRRGRGTAMPAFATITDPEVARLGAYLDELCTQAGRPGADLWAGNCASCHGADAGGGRNALGQDGPDVRCNRAIREPVRNGEDGMPAYPGLSDADISRIQQYLATSACPANAPGADLYAGNCVSCHGADARGVRGLPSIRCNRGIHDPVRAGVVGTLGTMPAFTAMPDAEIGRIQGYLLGLCPPGTASGADLYAGNCATCHAADAGGAGESPSVRCSTLVADALARGRGTRMPSFPALTGVDLTAVDGFLAGLCSAAGRTGADLYAGNCASCHGASAQGGRNGLGERGPGIQCTGASDYLEKCRNGEDSMPAFPGLSDPDVTAIVNFVHGAFCLGR